MGGMGGVVITNGAPVGGSVGGPSRIAVVTTQFDKTNNTLANITGLSFAVEAGRTYAFEAFLLLVPPVGGCKFAIAGTATATAIIAEGLIYNEDASVFARTRVTALGSVIAGMAQAEATERITGTITVNAAGTLTVQFAQTTTDVTASSVLVGSTFEVQAIS